MAVVQVLALYRVDNSIESVFKWAFGYLYRIKDFEAEEIMDAYMRLKAKGDPSLNPGEKDAPEAAEAISLALFKEIDPISPHTEMPKTEEEWEDVSVDCFDSGRVFNW